MRCNLLLWGRWKYQCSTNPIKSCHLHFIITKAIAYCFSCRRDRGNPSPSCTLLLIAGAQNKCKNSPAFTWFFHPPVHTQTSSLMEYASFLLVNQANAKIMYDSLLIFNLNNRRIEIQHWRSITSSLLKGTGAQRARERQPLCNVRHRE